MSNYSLSAHYGLSQTCAWATKNRIQTIGILQIGFSWFLVVLRQPTTLHIVAIVATSEVKPIAFKIVFIDPLIKVHFPS